MTETGYNISIPPPEPFSFEPKEWPSWRTRYERWANVTQMSTKSEKEQVDCLLYTMGPRAEDILLQCAEDDVKSYGKVIKCMEDYFLPKRNIIYERYMFNSRKQEENEKVGEFITSLFKLAEYCNFKELKDELIRDRLVVGMKDKKASEKLQLKRELQLEEAILMAKQAERQKEQSKVIEGKKDELVLEVNRVRMAKSNKDAVNSSKEKCWHCGRARHPREHCGAVKSTCFQCGRVGHFASMCKAGKFIKKTEVLTEPEEVQVLQVSLGEGSDRYIMGAYHLP